MTTHHFNNKFMHNFILLLIYSDYQQKWCINQTAASVFQYKHFFKTNRSESYALKQCYHIPGKNIPIIMISAALCWVLKVLCKCDFLTTFIKIYLFLLPQVVKLNTVQYIFPHTSCGGATVNLNIWEAVTISCLHSDIKITKQNDNSS